MDAKCKGVGLRAARLAVTAVLTGGFLGVCAVSGVGVDSAYAASAAPVCVTKSYVGYYDGKAHTLASAKVKNAESVSVYYSTKTKLTKSNYTKSGSETKPTRTKVGTTKVYVLYKYKVNSKGSWCYSSAAANITIKKKTLVESYSGIYDGRKHGVKVTPTSGTVYYSTHALTHENYKKYGKKESPTRALSGGTTVYYAIVPKSGKVNAATVKTGTATIRISRCNLSKVTPAGIAPSYDFANAYISPNFTLSYEGYTLEDGKDYTYTFENNRNKGTASVVLKGKGNFQGTRYIDFKINPVDVSKVDFTLSQTFYWCPSETPACPSIVSAVFNHLQIPKNTYEIVGYEGNTSPGTAYVVVRGYGNYTGTVKLPFTILPDPDDEDENEAPAA